LSREHFRLEFSVTACRLVDLNSRNGTFVNDRRATTVLLRDGDVIVAGSTIFVCEGKFSA
jgi:eukaryotic-like serine/threonine-protein kinase